MIRGHGGDRGTEKGKKERGCNSSVIGEIKNDKGKKKKKKKKRREKKK